MSKPSKKAPDMSVTLGRMRLSNPVMVASGTFGYGTEPFELLRKTALGAFVTKTVTLKPREGNPPPRIAETACGMLNSIGLENPGVDAFRREILPELADLGVPVVVSIGGERREDYASLAKELSSHRAVAALEVNVSCPNIGGGGMAFSEEPAELEQVVRGVTRAASLPVWVKLSPNVTRISESASAALEGGAEVLVVANTFKGMAVDIETGRSKLNRLVAGLSGPAIKPLTVAKVWEVVSGTGAPVVASGGIFTWEDAVEYLVTGARAVQLGTVNFVEPGAPSRILRGITEFCRKKGVAAVEELIGSLES